ncbi:phosphatidate cytidylyltransferase [Aquincola tertiaricarbonis]|uniref:Phosphatidate cytidylyltransferase n=1 Tax=Aquincola tertiaricarbonis TaxID=391953 RepID=A0ABY4SCC9_AQUTE|nr:phosphatidate cytidylyltransferase [Aquincola tertiaricarbonis]URI09567.1 phosphatidate cytidylyltransferase [Aquincola tertiaricarbonis]
MTLLRNLGVDQQVALLFVIVFGLLMMATAAVVGWSLRHPEASNGATGRHLKRDLRALWTGAVLFWLAWVWGALGATLLFGIVSFLALREFITLQHTRRSDHRSLILAFFVVLPLQYLIVGTRHFDLFTVFIPVYVFFALPVVSALAGDPERFLERNAKIQWGIVVCVYGLSHAPALLLLDFPNYEGRGAFLLFFLVFVVVIAQLAQEGASRWLRRRPVARLISRSFSMRALALGALAAALAGALLYWATPFKAGQALAMAFIAAGSGTFGEFVMKALKRDAGVHHWGNRSAVTGAVGLLDRVAPLCFAAPVFFHFVRWYFHL